MRKVELINFTKLRKYDKKKVLSWRNHPSIKKWMFTTNDIKIKDHLKFINHLKSEENKIYFLVKENGIGIGVINFTSINENSLIIGLYLNPKIKAKGDILMNEIIKFSFDKIKVKKILVEVYRDNEKAYNFYKRYNFVSYDKKYINDRQVICMELLNENRKL